MRKIALLLLISFGSFAQKNIRTFDQIGLSYGWNEAMLVPAFSIGQEMVIGDDFKYVVGAFARLNWNRLNTQTFESKGNFDTDELTLLEKANVVSISFPLSAAVGYKNFSVGGNFDLLSLTLGKNLNSNKFSLTGPTEGFEAQPRGFSWFLGKNTSVRNLSNQIYLNFTMDESFGIRIGMSSQHLSYDLRNLEEDGKIGTRENIFGKTYVYPFISLRFNNEK